MERATHPADAHAQAHPAPVARDPDLPQVSDRVLMLFAAAALIATAAVLLALAH
ncbi:MAG TPA: hypothetical protein VGP97_21990 [Burkholderiales bacterium]|jgi:hypothetical protein|nr:hypothetical protein [Burkholderiales bacterium]